MTRRKTKKEGWTIDTAKHAAVVGIIAMINLFAWAVVLWLILGAVCEAGCGISDQEGIVCVMGEARGEGKTGMLAHAYALLNRGTTNGVYGCRAKFNEPAWVWEQARSAWAYAKANPEEDITNGARYWASLLVDQRWQAKMEAAGYIKTAVIKNTAFYKEP